jgi:hypothetical protein
MATIEDPIPVGHVSLAIAFQRYHDLQHGTLTDQAVIDSFQGHLEKDELRAKVRDPQTGTEFAIPREAWRGAWYANRIFSSKMILGIENENDAFKPYAGRTPYVVEEELSSVMAARSGEVKGNLVPANSASCRHRKSARFASDDAPLLDEMRRLIANREAASPNEASLLVARQAVERAEKSGFRPAHLRASAESIARRLRKHFLE